jgi:hypothetical protein
VQRARQAVAASPDGKLAKRLGVNQDQPLPVTIGRKEAINRQGRKVKAPISGNVVSDSMPVANAAQRQWQGRARTKLSNNTIECTRYAQIEPTAIPSLNKSVSRT